jgi:hypothetical protein
MGEYSETYLIVDFSVLAFIGVLLLVANALMYALVLFRHQRRKMMATLDRLVIGMDANQGIALVDLFMVTNDAKVAELNEALKEAAAGDTGAMFTVVFDSFAADGRLTDTMASQIQAVAKARVDAIIASTKARISASAA